MEKFFRLVYKRKNDSFEYYEDYEDSDSVRADFIVMTQYEKDDYDYVVLDEITTNYSDYENIEILDAWYADEE